MWNKIVIKMSFLRYKLSAGGIRLPSDKHVWELK